MVIRIHDMAALEAAEEALYFEGKRQGFGEEFDAQLSAAISRILDNPNGGAPIEGTPFRKRHIFRFPVAAIYQIVGDEIRVMAFANYYRREGYWMGRSF